jgi:hypothetical protein
VEWHDNPFNRFMLHPRDFGFADAPTSAAMGLDRREHGMLLCIDATGARCTLVGDADYVRLLMEAPEGVRSDLAIPPGKFPVRREGWPEDWQPEEQPQRT